VFKALEVGYRSQLKKESRERDLESWGSKDTDRARSLWGRWVLRCGRMREDKRTVNMMASPTFRGDSRIYFQTVKKGARLRFLKGYT
jgi:hypothetical protein